jgi:hypothetical protein
VTLGPYDSADAPDDSSRIDFGGLRIGTRGGLEIHADFLADQTTISQLRLVFGQTVIAVQAFAVARGELMWPGVRTEILSGLERAKVSSHIDLNSWGTEITALLPSVTNAKQKVLRPTRFIGIDGDRWFLRIVVAGDGALDELERSRADELIGEIVVHRGDGPMAPGQRLNLNLPTTA